MKPIYSDHVHEATVIHTYHINEIIKQAIFLTARNGGGLVWYGWKVFRVRSDEWEHAWVSFHLFHLSLRHESSVRQSDCQFKQWVQLCAFFKLSILLIWVTRSLLQQHFRGTILKQVSLVWHTLSNRERQRKCHCNDNPFNPRKRCKGSHPLALIKRLRGEITRAAR